MIRYYKSNTPGIIEKHVIELIDITVLERERQEQADNLARLNATMTADEITAENEMRTKTRAAIQAQVQTLDARIAELKSVKDPTPKEI